MASSSHERKVQGYLKPTYHTFITNYAKVFDLTESQAVGQAVKALQDSLPQEIKQRIASNPKNGY